MLRPSPLRIPAEGGAGCEAESPGQDINPQAGGLLVDPCRELITIEDWKLMGF